MFICLTRLIRNKPAGRSLCLRLNLGFTPRVVKHSRLFPWFRIILPEEETTANRRCRLLTCVEPPAQIGSLFLRYEMRSRKPRIAVAYAHNISDPSHQVLRKSNSHCHMPSEKTPFKRAEDVPPKPPRPPLPLLLLLPRNINENL